MTKTGIVLNARLQSTRLPKKHLREVNQEPIFLYLIKRIIIEFRKEITNNEVIVIIASSDIPDNQKFEFFKKNGVKIFYGSLDNIPLRQKELTKKFQLDSIISVDGDDIFCSTKGMRKIFKELQSGEKFIKTVNLPLGLNVMGYTSNFLDYSLTGFENKPLEMGWGRIFDEKQLLSVSINFVWPSSVSSQSLRFTLDYKEDFDFFEKVIKSLRDNIYYFNDQEIVDWVINNEFHKINEPIAKIYWDNFYKLLGDEKDQVIDK